MSKKDPKKFELDAHTYILSYMYDDSWDDGIDDDLDFGTFDPSGIQIDFEELIDLLDTKDLDRLNMDYDFLTGASDKTFENESKINTKPRSVCKHDMEKKFLITSFYFKCKKCDHEEG